MSTSQVPLIGYLRGLMDALPLKTPCKEKSGVVFGLCDGDTPAETAALVPTKLQLAGYVLLDRCLRTQRCLLTHTGTLDQHLLPTGDWTLVEYEGDLAVAKVLEDGEENADDQVIFVISLCRTSFLKTKGTLSSTCHAAARSVRGTP